MRNYPLRGGKWTLYEGGIRVPFMVRGPGIKAGIQSDVPVAGWDLLPTINELAGNTKKVPGNIDGGSLVPVIKNSGQEKCSGYRMIFTFTGITMATRIRLLYPEIIS